MERLISTRHVATMLGVSEASVKRRADSGALPCIRSPGGHRRFLLREVAVLASQIGGNDAEAPLDERSVKEMAGALMVGDAEKVIAMVTDARSGGASMAEIGDVLIQPAVKLLRLAIAEGHCGASCEHLARETILALWGALRPTLVRPGPPCGVALVAPSPGESSDVLARLAALAAVENRLIAWPMGSGMSGQVLAETALTVGASWVVLGFDTAQDAGPPGWQQSFRERLKGQVREVWLGEPVPERGGRANALLARDLRELQQHWSEK